MKKQVSGTVPAGRQPTPAGSRARSVALAGSAPLCLWPCFLILEGLATSGDVSDDHGFLLTSSLLIRVFGQQ